MGKCIGIDLGTTNAAIAVMDGGRPKILEDEKGYRVLPTVVSAKEDGKFVVGQAAKSLVLTTPEDTVFEVKRLMGLRFDSAEAKDIRERVPFAIEEAEDGTCLVGMRDVFYTPQEVAAVILQVAAQIAERNLDEPVDEVVITVPAYFNHAQRSATLEAARLAKLPCERLVNEPTAAAIAYGYRQPDEATVVVFDLGGGTFDVSILRVAEGLYEILATTGDSFLGGTDFDQKLVMHMVDHFEQSHAGTGVRGDKVAMQRLRAAAEKAKCELSTVEKTMITVPRLTPTADFEMALSRAGFETLVSELVGRTLSVTKSALASAGLEPSDIDDVVLVGGQTRMPTIREQLTKMFGKAPNRGVHPDECVAIGASIHADMLSGPAENQAVLLDVTPFDLGIDVAGGRFEPIIRRNSQVPLSQARVFSTNKDMQERVRLVVRQGNEALATDNEFLGEFSMTGLTPAPRMETKVEVAFRIDTNGMLHVVATEVGTGEQKKIVVRNYAEVAASEGQSPDVQ
ncbi:MAG: Hsp70 family protein, partial [Myxococcota bacterium]|nr:Hsp70 family protein [Myxococcota bacterium]